MARDPLFIVAAIACLAVVVVLLVGVGSFARGGAFNRNRVVDLALEHEADRDLRASYCRP